MARITRPEAAVTRRRRSVSTSERASSSSKRSRRLETVRVQRGTPRRINSAWISGTLGVPQGADKGSDVEAEPVREEGA